MRVALLHDYLTQIGGAERVLEELCEMFPQAPVYTLIYDKDAMGGLFEDREIRTSFLQRVPFTKRHHRFFPPLMPMATEHLDISDFDLVVSSSSSFIKGAITSPNTTHVSFCHTPLRYAWDDSHRYINDFEAFPRTLKLVLPPVLTYLRLWDYSAAQRPDVLVANSNHVKRRIKKYYGRDAHVVHPPVRTKYFENTTPSVGDAFLMAGRLMAYKRFDLGIAAAKAANVKLRIVGDGPEYKNLKAIADPNVTFLSGADDAILRDELSSARALLFPQEEDFGILAVEALASGTPVIAYANSGASEIIEDGVSGVAVHKQEVNAFAEALSEFRPKDFPTDALRKRAALFNQEAFRRGMSKIIERALKSR